MTGAATFTVFGNHGVITARESDGVVLEIEDGAETTPAESYRTYGLVRFDVAEWTQHYGEPIRDVDILDIGYWCDVGYEPPAEGHSALVAEGWRTLG